MDNSNKKYKKSDPIIFKVDEPTIEYNVEEKIYTNIEDHPLFAKVIEKSIKEAEEGKLIPHEEVMKRFSKKFPLQK